MSSSGARWTADTTANAPRGSVSYFNFLCSLNYRKLWYRCHGGVTFNAAPGAGTAAEPRWRRGEVKGEFSIVKMMWMKYLLPVPQLNLMLLISSVQVKQVMSEDNMDFSVCSVLLQDVLRLHASAPRFIMKNYESETLPVSQSHINCITSSVQATAEASDRKKTGSVPGRFLKDQSHHQDLENLSEVKISPWNVLEILNLRTQNSCSGTFPVA